MQIILIRKPSLGVVPITLTHITLQIQKISAAVTYLKVHIQKRHGQKPQPAKHKALFTAHEVNQSDLNCPATSRPNYTTRSLVTRVSVTTWLTAAKLEQLVLE